MYKWLTIMGIVCFGFVVVLLSLGYALKENEAATTALKNKLNQEKLNATEQSSPKAQLTFVDKDKVNLDKLTRYKNIIVKNVTCVNSAQCVLIDTKEVGLNCVVAVNTIGASLLMKELRKDFEGKSIPQNNCDVQAKNLTQVCAQNMCQVEALITEK
ncbi:hypothetical protein WNY51_14555 [Pseudocolwellia sp. AS88]|uniref:hypothetical protein n=1 Tax=Pseudocolwellia sp. AS88 TaxID=3063958 RepID=UPI0026EED97F|nr:hypothetical protein [Pseudocolwellia sp. AS88]MDO7086191.1 hypothetical protein [Pseudocolwellia sp. AS88]